MNLRRHHSRLVLSLCAGFLGAVLWAGCSGAPPAPTADEGPDLGEFVGAPVCAECHKEISEKQARSPHALTLRSNPVEWAADKINPTLRVRDVDGAGEYGVAVRNNQVQQLLFRDGKEVAATPFHYLLGSGHHGVSAIFYNGSDWRYLKVTYYAEGGWGYSPLHGVSEDAAGRRQDDGWPLTQSAMADCLRCHTTRLEFDARGLDAQRTEFGVRCETCHGPGKRHVEAARAKRREQAIENPRKWTTDAFITLCQQCHSGMSEVEGMLVGAGDDPNSPRLVLNHTHGVTQSRCFRESQGKLRCTSCHDPHAPAESNPQFYVARCLTCHQPPAGKTACPVQPKGNCLPCHMPKVEVAPHTRFADHWIRAKSPFAPGFAAQKKAAK